MIAVGSAYQGSCYQSPEAAAAAQCIGSFPVTGVDGTGPYSLACNASTATSLTLARSRVDGTSEPMELPVSYYTCVATDIGTAVITPELAAQAFMWGLSLIVGSYLVAWCCSQILNAISRDETAKP